METAPINNILEGTTSADIESTDSNLTVNNMFQQSSVESLAKRISSVMPLSGPNGGIFNIKKDSHGNFTIIRRDTEVYPNPMIKTGVTQEVIADMKSIYGKEASVVIGKLFRGIANDIENAQLITFLNDNAKDDGTLALSNAVNAEDNLAELMQKIHDIVIKMNQKSFRTYEAFAVLPSNCLSSIYTFGKLYGFHENFRENNLFLTKITSTNFYLNPDVNDTNVYVGLQDLDNPARSSIVYSPYQQQIIEAPEYDTGNLVYFLINRFALAMNPLHESGKEMLYKFNVTK